MTMLLAALVVAATVTAAKAPAAATATTAPHGPSSCVSCHNGEMFDAQARAKIAKFKDDVHAQAGLSCEDCHGGNPADTTDPMAAMDRVLAELRAVRERAVDERAMGEVGTHDSRLGLEERAPAVGHADGPA